MENLFLKILNMSITAGWIVLAVILLRLLLKKAPRWLLCGLWIFVGLRLILPFSFESVFSLVPSQKQISQTITRPTFPIVEHFDSVPAEDLYTESFIGDLDGMAVEIPAVEIPLEGVSSGSFDILSVISIVWLAGIAVLLIYAFVSWLKLRKTVSESVCIGENIYICDRIDSPFILGVFAPKIYLPSSMDKDVAEHVISHEKAHLKRFDHLWKPLGYLILTVHWFNPLVWVAYILLCRDIELACDEAVIKKMSAESKKAYSTALLTCSLHRQKITACPLAFGEVGVKERIHNVLNYKKPAFWVIILCIIACIVLTVCFMTDPKEVSHEIVGSNFSVKEVVVGDGDGSERFSVTADLYLYEYDTSSEKWEKKGQLKEYYQTDDEIEASLVETVDIDEIADSYYLLYGNVYYTVFKTVNGETYLGRGLSTDSVEELYLLESELGKRGNNYIYESDFFNRSLRIAAGESVSAFNFSFRDDFLVVGFTSGTDSYSGFQNDMGYAIFTMHEDGYLLREWHVYSGAARVTSGIFVCPDPAVLSLDGKMTDKNTYDVILCSNSNLAAIERTVKNSDSVEKKREVPVIGQKSMTLFRWADDNRTAESSVSLRFYDSQGNELTWNNILPEDISDISENIRAYSGSSNCLVYAYESGTPLEEIKSSVNWLRLLMDESQTTPFDVYCGDNEIYGYYYLYDAETLESVKFAHPSGLEPQTYILQNAVRGKEYLVLFRANPYGTGADENLYAFGITLPLLEEVTDPFAESESPITWLKNLSVEDIYTVTAKIDGGDELDFGIRMLRSLVEALNSVPDHAVYMGRGVPYETSVTVKCGSRTYTLGYGGGLVEISFDSQTRSLYPDGIWQINDPNLAAWFEDLVGYDFTKPEDDAADFIIDFIKKMYSFYNNCELLEMDFSDYTDDENIAKALEYYRSNGYSSHKKYQSGYFLKKIIPSVEYLNGISSDRIYLNVKVRIDSQVNGKRSWHSDRVAYQFALKKTEKGYRITDFEKYTVDYDRLSFRYGSFTYFPIDDWEKNGEKYLSIIKGETELISELELGKQLLAEFEANIENYKEKYEVFDVDFSRYDGNLINPGYFIVDQADEIAASTESRGVIIVFNTGRYVAAVGKYIMDPLVLDGTIPDEMYVVYGQEYYMEYFWANPTEPRCYFEDAQYIVALD